MGSNFQERLKEGMNLRGLRQADLAIKTGLSKSRINHYVSGKYEAKQDALYLIAKALNVNEAWLMGHDVPSQRTINEVETDLCNGSSVLKSVCSNFGTEASNLLISFLQLNESGQKKALEMLQDLLDVPKYRKDEEK